MRLEKKKELFARALGVGKNRISLNTNMLAEIKEAITKQDVRDLLAAGAVTIKEIKGRALIVKRKTRRRAGSIRQKVKNSKRGYIILTRKLRSYLATLKKTNKLSTELIRDLRKEIRARAFKSLAHMKERISEVTK
jgi:large subunit ribosomal protein L19e